MAVKQFPQDFNDISYVADKLIGAKTDGTPGYILLTSVVRADVNGNVGIGTNAPAAKLHIVGNEFVDGSIYTDVVRPYNTAVLKLLNGGFNVLHVDGSVGIGKNNPTQRLDVVGNILASGSITPGSDKRLKSNIKNLPSSIDKINKLRPISYTLKEDKATALGFIADEVREIFPDLVLEGKDEEKMLAMNYMGLTAPMVKAMQEMSATITQLKERIALLEAK